jgi:hypothetical protein
MFHAEALPDIKQMQKLILILYLLTATTLFGQNTNLSNGVVFDGEPYLAVNPNNSQHMVVAWMGWINLVNRFKIKTRTSFDGGQTWSIVVELPHTVSGYSSADPCVDFNNLGDVFISYIDFTGTTPPVTGGVYLCKSIDGGLSWNTPTEVINTNYDVTKWPIDRPWMVIDKSNSTNEGYIYITTFNLNRTNPSYNPYLSISSDTGNSFSTRYIDTTGWLAGSINPYPMCSPAVSSSGVFYGAYPSYVITQSLYIQAFLATSNDGGTSLTQNNIITFNPPANLSDYPLAKKGSLLLSNPSNPNHLTLVYLSAVLGDLDVYLIESLNSGLSWSSAIRVNDDPLSNNRMQDMVWGSYDNDGDLIISWRDRRNGTDSTFQTDTEIWAAYKDADSAQFEPNFQITTQTVAYDSILENSGNDFMCIKLQDDTLSATWGDTRNGKLNIWFQRTNTNGTILSTNLIYSENLNSISIYPNPTESILTVEGEMIYAIEIYDNNGKRMSYEEHNRKTNFVQINIENLNIGSYLVKVKTSQGELIRKIIKQ